MRAKRKSESRASTASSSRLTSSESRARIKSSVRRSAHGARPPRTGANRASPNRHSSAASLDLKMGCPPFVIVRVSRSTQEDDRATPPSDFQWRRLPALSIEPVCLCQIEHHDLAAFGTVAGLDPRQGALIYSPTRLRPKSRNAFALLDEQKLVTCFKPTCFRQTRPVIHFNLAMIGRKINPSTAASAPQHALPFARVITREPGSSTEQ